MVEMKKQRIIAAIIASALIAAPAMTASVYADNAAETMVTMDNPFSGVVEKQNDGTWKITDRGIKLIKQDMEEKDSIFYFHISLSEKSETFNIKFTLNAGDKEYGYTEEMLKLDGQKELYIPVDHVLEYIKENNKDADLSGAEYGSMDFGGGAKLVSDIEITAKDGTEETAADIFDRGVWAAYDTDGSLSAYYVFDDAENGHTDNGRSGVPFSLEYKGASIIFHMGGADDNTPAQIFRDAEGELYMTVDFGETSKTYHLLKVRGADPDTFDANTLLAKGVWAAYGKDDSGEYNRFITYYIFRSETDGEVTDGTAGSAFRCEQDGENIVFHMGSEEDNTPVKLSILPDGDYLAEFTESGSTVRLTLDMGADPDTFVPMPKILFDAGVWEAYNTADDSLYGYFVFRNEEEGSIDFGETGAPFMCEQNGDTILFHLFAADDNTWASFSYNEDLELIGTFDYGNDLTQTYRFVYLYDADAETFDAETYKPATFYDEGEKWVMKDTVSIADANGVAGGGNGISINYVQPLLEGFDVTFELELSDGTVKTFRANNTSTIDHDTIFFNLRELLSAIGVSADDVTGLSLRNNVGSAVYSVDIGAAPTSCVHIQFGTQAAAEVDTGNPHTGVEGIFAAAAAAALAGAAALTFRKRR